MSAGSRWAFGVVLGSLVATQAEALGSRTLPWEDAKLGCVLRKGRAAPDTLLVAASCRGRHSESRETGDSVIREFRDRLCQNPAQACDPIMSYLRGLPGPSSSGGIEVAGIPFDSYCNPHPVWVQAQMATPAQEAQIGETLRARTGAATTGLAVYQGETWEQARRVFTLVRDEMLRSLSTGGFHAPAAVLERIRGARLFDPNDPSIPTARRDEFLMTCGVSATAETKSPLGIPNAFAAPGGDVVICPKMLLSATSPAALGTVLVHELGHLVGPCQVGFDLASARVGVGCRIDETPERVSGQLMSWRRDLLTLESCFHRANLNRGRIPNWVVRILSASTSATPDAPDAPDAPDPCTPGASDFQPGRTPQEGLLSACDPSNLYLMATLTIGLEGLDPELPRRKRRADLVRMFLLSRRAEHPDSNQFDESFSDYLASRVLPGVLERLGRPIAPEAAERGLDEALGLSVLCDLDRPSSLRGEVHPEGDVRMGVLTSQPETRERMGCATRPGIVATTARTLKSCATFR